MLSSSPGNLGPVSSISRVSQLDFPFTSSQDHMTGVFEFVERVIWPDKPRGLVTRYGLALALPLGSVAITHAMFPLDTSLFSPLLALSIVCAATFGGIQVGIACNCRSHWC